MRVILAPHTGDVATLCACSMVSHAWLEAASEPTLWRQLRFVRRRKLPADEAAFRKAHGYATYGGSLANVTDARLATLIRRSRSVDGGLSYLDELDVRKLRSLTAGGVIAALHGLEGTLSSLRVDELRCTGVFDEDILDTLKSFLAPGASLDIDAVLLCGGSLYDGST